MIKYMVVTVTDMDDYGSDHVELLFEEKGALFHNDGTAIYPEDWSSEEIKELNDYLENKNYIVVKVSIYETESMDNLDNSQEVFSEYCFPLYVAEGGDIGEAIDFAIYEFIQVDIGDIEALYLDNQSSLGIPEKDGFKKIIK